MCAYFARINASKRSIFVWPWYDSRNRFTRSGITQSTRTPRSRQKRCTGSVAGPVYSAGIVAEIGPIARFPSDDALAKYAGLTGRTHQSGHFDAEDRPLTRAG